MKSSLITVSASLLSSAAIVTGELVHIYGTPVSVCGDASYPEPKGRICSGPADKKPHGRVCPHKGDVAKEDCYKYLESYDEYAAKCIAPEDAECRKLTTGAWGCVFPSVKCYELPCDTTTKPPYYPTTEDPYPTTEDPYPTTEDPYPTTGDPYPTTEDPYPTTEDPYPTTEKPYPTTKKPCPTTEEPYTPKPYPPKDTVSVCMDATYPASTDICSGPVSAGKPAGYKCPKKGDVAVERCYKYLKSYEEYSKTCVAPENAVCEPIYTGAFGCVFPSLGCRRTAPPTPYPSTVAPVPYPTKTKPAPVYPPKTPYPTKPTPVYPPKDDADSGDDVDADDDELAAAAVPPASAATSPHGISLLLTAVLLGIVSLLV